MLHSVAQAFFYLLQNAYALGKTIFALWVKKMHFLNILGFIWLFVMFDNIDFKKYQREKRSEKKTDKICLTTSCADKSLYSKSYRVGFILCGEKKVGLGDQDQGIQ